MTSQALMPFFVSPSRDSIGSQPETYLSSDSTIQRLGSRFRRVNPSLASRYQKLF
jgi:hypothetical protein